LSVEMKVKPALKVSGEEEEGKGGVGIVLSDGVREVKSHCRRCAMRVMVGEALAWRQLWIVARKEVGACWVARAGKRARGREIRRERVK